MTQETKDPKEVIQIASELSMRLKRRASDKLSKFLNEKCNEFLLATNPGKYCTINITVKDVLKQFERTEFISLYREETFKQMIKSWEDKEIEDFIKQVEETANKVDQLEEIINNLT